MAMVPIGVETFTKISITRVGCTNVTDRQTTDGRATTYSERGRALKMQTLRQSKKRTLNAVQLPLTRKFIPETTQF